MDEYTKGIELKFKSNIDNIIDQVEGLKKDAEEIFMNFSPSGKSTVEETKDSEEFTNSIFKFSKSVNEWAQKQEGLSELLTVQLPTSWMGVGTSLAKSAISMFKKAFEELNEMFSYSYLSNKAVRELRLTYGLDAGEAYSYSKAADIMGISSLEDFSFMTDEQYSLFQKTAQSFQSLYDEYGSDEEFNEQMYEFQVELERLKIEVLKPFLEIIINNKETIMNFIDYFPTLLQNLIDISTGLVAWLTKNSFVSARIAASEYKSLYSEEMAKDEEERDYEKLVEQYNKVSARPYGDMDVEQYKKMVKQQEYLKNGGWKDMIVQFFSSLGNLGGASIGAAKLIKIFINGEEQTLTETSSSNTEENYAAKTDSLRRSR